MLNWPYEPEPERAKTMVTDSEWREIVRTCVTACHGLELPTDVERGALKECLDVLTHLSKSVSVALTKGALRPATEKDEPIVQLLMGMVALADRSLEKGGEGTADSENQ